VLLAERWAAEQPGVKVVTCHPGWTLTDGVEAAYGRGAAMRVRYTLTEKMRAHPKGGTPRVVPERHRWNERLLKQLDPQTQEWLRKNGAGLDI
jgi:NAD(P)-dependent dehydrogenase (short-subunit alcohol dehydrogenase family)